MPGLDESLIAIDRVCLSRVTFERHYVLAPKVLHTARLQQSLAQERSRGLRDSSKGVVYAFR